ncbi:hypothetical protein [Azonexus fungiphilus]|uniref:hypothetical protein n=1 Tax=Azonexus fungiphilus TaxID=146940 RepID=UPI00156B733B|nr:hypothetical protein [Azonexus fungiphilus]NHC08152.1 hypothetical protein [Azonexus fungiphilus]
MKWQKKSIIVSSETLDLSWYQKNTMVPVPMLVAADRLRIFLTMCDADNVGRIGYVDVHPDHPDVVIAYSAQPVLDVGEPGFFDDSGVLPSAIFEENGRHYMFYSAYQKHEKVPYSILTGLAVFDGPDFNTLKRVSTVPLLERTEAEQFIRSAVFCRCEAERYTIYYSSGSSWIHNSIKEAPRYDIKCIESHDLRDWTAAMPRLCIPLKDDEYGLTTPSVFIENGVYKLYYSIRSVSKGYRLGYAESTDGLSWTRMDEKMGIEVSATGWDSEMICFGNIFKYKDKTYLFYCGNHYGMGGMGYAILEEE